MRFSKRGIVSQGVAASYALYKQRLASPSGGRPRDRLYRVRVRATSSIKITRGRPSLGDALGLALRLGASPNPERRSAP